MNPDFLQLLLLLFIVLLTWLFSSGFKTWQKKRLIENIPTSKIRSMAMGLVELHGKAKFWRHSLKGPLSNKDCVYYKYKILRNLGDSWATIAQGDSHDDFFYLDDGTGKVLVYPKEAEIKLDNPTFSYDIGSFSKDIPENLSDFLNQNNIMYQSHFGTHRISFLEWNIYPDDQIYILGSLTKNDLLKEPNIILDKGNEETIFIISKKSEKELLKNLYWLAPVEIILMILIIITSILLIFYVHIMMIRK